MQWSDVSFAPPSKTLRQFAWLFMLLFGALAGWHGLARQDAGLATVFALLAASIGPLGIVWPRAIRLIFVAWLVLAFPVGWLVSRAVLASIFYGVFTPVGLAFRLMGRDALNRKGRPRRDSYWTPKPMSHDSASYFRKF